MKRKGCEHHQYINIVTEPEFRMLSKTQKCILTAFLSLSHSSFMLVKI